MMTQFINARMLAQLEFEQYIEEQAKNFPLSYEIDSVNDDVFGELYRVWLGTRLVGTFYLNINGYWVSQPCNGGETLLCLILARGLFPVIVAISAHRVQVARFVEYPLLLNS
jgi:hypothetical protein